MEDTEFNVSGFVRNEGSRSVFKVQRMLPPGSKLDFSDAYLALSKKSGGLEGEDFVKWLRKNIFPGPDWGFYKADDKPFFNSSSRKDVASEAPPPLSSKSRKTASGRKMSRKDPETRRDNRNKIKPAQLVEADFSQARVLIEKCQDKSVLRKGLTLSKNLANRGEHMRHIMRRLEQVY